MDWRIRAITSEDIPALNALTFVSKASNGYDAAFMEECREELTLDEQRIAGWVTRLAEGEQGSVLGYYSLSFDGGIAQVEMFFIRPDLKRRGIGRGLWKSLAEDVKANGASIIRIDSDPFSAPFYQAMGARQIGTVPSGSIAGRVLPLLQIDLAKASHVGTG